MHAAAQLGWFTCYVIVGSTWFYTAGRWTRRRFRRHRHRFLVFVTTLAILYVAFFARPAKSATWVHFTGTTPSDSGVTIDHFRMEWKNGAAWDSARIYRSPGVEGVPVPPPGQPFDLYVSQTIAPLTSRTWSIVTVNTNGRRSERSNLCVVATGFPDTIACLSRPAWGALNEYGFVRTYGVSYCGFSLLYGDSADVRAMHLEELQRQFQPRECQLFGSWALRGLQAVCP